METCNYLGPSDSTQRRLIADSRRQTSPNDRNKRLDDLVWNKTEVLLLPAEADVLEIFDW